MKIHALNAQGKLTPYIDFIECILRDTHRQVSEQLVLPSIDVFVKTKNYVIPEKGIVGYCPEEHLIYSTIDTDSPKFIKDGKESLKRMLHMSFTMQFGGGRPAMKTLWVALFYRRGSLNILC